MCRSILTRMGQLHYADSDTIYHIITSKVNLKLLRKTANKDRLLGYIFKISR